MNRGPLTATEKDQLRALLARSHVDDLDQASDFSFVEESSMGGMSDAAKRRLGEQHPDVPTKRGYTAESSEPEVLGFTPKGKEIKFPPGVEEMKVWGQTIIEFGKYQAAKDQSERTYEEAYQFMLKEDVHYLRYLCGQVESAKGQLLDMASYVYLRRAEKQHAGKQLPMIPGTSYLRRIKET